MAESTHLTARPANLNVLLVISYCFHSFPATCDSSAQLRSVSSIMFTFVLLFYPNVGLHGALTLTTYRLKTF